MCGTGSCEIFVLGSFNLVIGGTCLKGLRTTVLEHALLLTLPYLTCEFIFRILVFVGESWISVKLP